MANILDIEVRKKILEDIFSEENKRRKVDSFKRLDIYKKNQRKYILERISKDLSPETIANMRTFTSINFTKKIIDAKSSIYKNKPERIFVNATEREKEQIEALYEYAEVDKKLKKANRIYKLQDQAAIQIIPKEGCLHFRILNPHHFDVVPRSDLPEKAACYILSGFNKQDAWNDVSSVESIDSQSRGSTTSAGYYDNQNQSVADKDDYQSQLNYFVWWSDEYHFATDQKGQILDENNQPYVTVNANDVLNPIGKIPFIDVVTDRDFEYWAQTGSNVTDLQLDIGAQISDTCDVNFRQGYSQAILSATEAPKSMQIGPHTLLFLKKDPRAEAGAQPEFEFATPSPDLASSIRLTEMLIAMGLTSEGMDASAISTGPNTSGEKTYSSGYERLLAQIEEFSASQDDFDTFTVVEKEVFELMKLWNNTLQNVTGPLELKPELKGGVISDNVEFDVIFKPPTMVQSQTEKEDGAIKKMEAGLMSRKMAVQTIYDVPEEKAEEIIKEIDEEMSAQTAQQDEQNNEDEKLLNGVDQSEENDAEGLDA